MSYSQNSSSSSSSRGLGNEQRQYFSWQTPEEYNYIKGAARRAAADPGGLSYMPTVDKLLPVGKYGTAASGDAGIAQLGRDMFSKTSGARAQRGFTTAPNLESVIGDSLRMASPQLIPLAQQYALQRAAMAPQLQQMSMGYTLTPMQIISNLLAGTGESSASGFGFGAGWNDSGNAAAGGAATAMGI